jgi:hypothetical protein
MKIRAWLLRGIAPCPFTSLGFAVQPAGTTGAGDCFAAGFLAFICRGQSLTLAARYARVTGKVAALGLVAPIPPLPLRCLRVFCALILLSEDFSKTAPAPWGA